MAISVTNSGADLIISDGSREISVPKNLVRVSDTDNNVRIQWSETEYMQTAYNLFTAPTGASAAAVKNAIEAFLDTGAPVGASENMLGSVGGNTVTVNGSITRPADTTTYAANDVITNSTSTPTIITFSGCSRLTTGATGRSGIIQSATLIDSANETLKLDGDLFIFDTTVTMDNDNAAFTPTDAELATVVAIITFTGSNSRSGTAGAGGNVAYPNTISGGIPFNCLTLSNLFGIFVARNAYVPISAEVFTFRLGILQD